MRLKAPYAGGYVEATGELAERLIARGFKAEELPKKPPRKRASKTKEE